MPGHRKRKGGKKMITIFRNKWEKMIDFATRKDRPLVYAPVADRAIVDLVKKEVMPERSKQ
jgi:hypothetical protein